MVRDYSSLIERFPAYREQALKQRFRDEVLDELCRDYDRVLRALKAQEAESEPDISASNKCQELEGLARNLEHEYLKQLANYKASN